MSTLHLSAASLASPRPLESASPGHPITAVPPETVPVPAPTAVRMLNSDDIFSGSREVCIAHRGALYRLRITMQNRLILQK